MRQLFGLIQVTPDQNQGCGSGPGFFRVWTKFGSKVNLKFPTRRFLEVFFVGSDLGLFFSQGSDTDPVSVPKP